MSVPLNDPENAVSSESFPASATALSAGAGRQAVVDFTGRHIGPGPAEIAEMLGECGCESLDALAAAAVPGSILSDGPLNLPAPRSESEALGDLREIASRNRVRRSFVGMGYHDCIVPPVIQRNVLENPGWYTQYTPYQAEIAQGRLEALLTFQTMVCDLTGMDVANASLLDEGTAVAEAMTMCFNVGQRRHRGEDRRVFFVADNCQPQTISVVETRAEAIDVRVVVVPVADLRARAEGEGAKECFGAVVQYPGTVGDIEDLAPLFAKLGEAGVMTVVAADLLALTLLRPPGDFGADIAVGSAQRFGVPLGFGGPHAAFFATRDEHKRQMLLVALSRRMCCSRVCSESR